MLGRFLGLSILLAGLSVVGPTAPHGGAVPHSSSVALYSDPDEFVGMGRQLVLDDSNSKIRIEQADRGAIIVHVSRGSVLNDWGLTFTVPKGKALRRGVYANAIRPREGEAGLDVVGEGRACNVVDGRFQILDLRRNRAGVVNRLWVVFEQHCERARKALFGEVRIGEPRLSVAAVEPALVRWPPAEVSHPTTVVPVAFRAFGAPVRVKRVAVTGPAAGDYPIRTDECTGRLLRHASCRVWVELVARKAGIRRATLTFVDSTGRRRHAALEDVSFGGRTVLSVTSEPGEPIGLGRNWDYNEARDDIKAWGGRLGVTFEVFGADGHYWAGHFEAPPGMRLAPGTYSNASYPPSGSGPVMFIGEDDRECYNDVGQFTVDSATWWPDDSVHTFGVTFEQRCGGATAALRGSFLFRVGDGTPLPPWMRERRGRRLGPPCTVPRVLGFALPRARKVINGANCRVGKLSWRRSSAHRGVVIAQSPRPRAHFATPIRVRLVISRGPR